MLQIEICKSCGKCTHPYCIWFITPVNTSRGRKTWQVSLGYWEVINPETNSYTQYNQDNTKGSLIKATNKDAQILSVSAMCKWLNDNLHCLRDYIS